MRYNLFSVSCWAERPVIAAGGSRSGYAVLLLLASDFGLFVEPFGLPFPLGSCGLRDVDDDAVGSRAGDDDDCCSDG